MSDDYGVSREQQTKGRKKTTAYSKHIWHPFKQTQVVIVDAATPYNMHWTGSPATNTCITSGLSLIHIGPLSPAVRTVQVMQTLDDMHFVNNLRN